VSSTPPGVSHLGEGEKRKEHGASVYLSLKAAKAQKTGGGIKTGGGRKG